MIVNPSIIEQNEGMNLNDVKRAIGENNKQIKSRLTGQLDDLKTKNKGSLVDAINEVFQSGSDFKKKLADAITSIGGGGYRTQSPQQLMTL